MEKIGFIGMGNMGYAILKGLLQVYKKEDIIATDVNPVRMEEVTTETGITHAAGNAECVSHCKYVILAVKPQYYDAVLENILHTVTSDHVLISIAPGITIADLRGKLGPDRRIVRAMPNTPALVGEGMTGVCYDASLFSREEIHTISAVFQSFGRMKMVEERLMNAVVCISGSSPAYVYLFIEALADSGVKYGLSRADAYEMAAQTVLGSATMVLETGMHPGVLKDNVCSPGGTTIAAVSALEECGFRSSIIRAADACYKKCLNIE